MSVCYQCDRCRVVVDHRRTLLTMMRGSDGARVEVDLCGPCGEVVRNALRPVDDVEQK